MVLQRALLYKMKGPTHPLPEFCDAEGPGLSQAVGHYQETHGLTAIYARIQEHLPVLHILCSGHTGWKSVLGVRVMGVRVSERFERLGN